MKKIRGILWGIVVIAIGIIWGLNAADVITFNIFFSGWWTLFIIVPCFIDLFTGDNKGGSAIGLSIGVILLLACNFDFSEYKKFLIPIILVIVGIVTIISTVFGHKKSENFNPNVINDSSKEEYFVSFSGQKYAFDNTFKGGKFSATFGGMDIDLTNIQLENDIYITTSTVFGGINILAPRDTKVVVKSNSIFGGTTDKSYKNVSPDARVIYISAQNLFGGLEIR